MFIARRRRNPKIGAMASTETGGIVGVSQAKKWMRPVKYTCPSMDRYKEPPQPRRAPSCFTAAS